MKSVLKDFGEREDTKRRASFKWSMSGDLGNGATCVFVPSVVGGLVGNAKRQTRV